jgi:hypothetical protein
MGDVMVSGNNICGNGQHSFPLPVSVTHKLGPAGEITGFPEVCQGMTYVEYFIVPVQYATSYTWTIPPGASIAYGANTNQVFVDFGTSAASGNLTVFASNSCGAGAVSPAYAVTVHPKPPTPVVTASGNTLTSSAPAGNQWFRNGAPVSGATSQVYIVPASQPGWYRTVVELGACYSDSSNKVYVAGVGVEENAILSFRVYPVPSKGEITAEISSTEGGTYRIQVYNTLGVQVYESADFRVSGIHREIIDLQQLPDGLYSVAFISDGRKAVRKVVIRR